MSYSEKTQVLRDLEINNDTLRFLLPVLYEYGLTDTEFLIEELQGIFLFDKNKADLGKNLFIKYKPSKSDRYAKIDAKITSLEGFKKDYDMDDCIMYVIDIESKFGPELEIFEKGLFSEFSEEHKNRIKNFWGLGEDSQDPLTGVLYHTEIGEKYFKTLPEELQKLTAENELWPIPNMEYETV